MPQTTRRSYAKKGRRFHRPFFHTADLGLHIWGRDLAELFIHAAEALMATLTDRRRLRRRERRDITVTAEDQETLLVAWLNYLLYLYDRDGFLGRHFRILELTPERLQGEAWGEIFEPERHIGKTAVKAATYHQLKIVPFDGGWQATVIFDL